MSKKRVFKTRHFAKFAAKAGLEDAALCDAVEEMQQGLIDADLGGGVVKNALLCLARARAEVRARLWRTVKIRTGFLFTALRKTIVPT